MTKVDIDKLIKNRRKSRKLFVRTTTHSFSMKMEEKIVVEAPGSMPWLIGSELKRYRALFEQNGAVFYDV